MRVLTRQTRLKTQDASGLQERVSGPEPNSGPLIRNWSARRTNLLELDFGAGLLELRLDLLGFFLGDALLDRLWRPFDKVFGLLEAKTGNGADLLDDLDLLLAGSGEHDRELGLLFGRGRRRGARRTAGR